MRSLLRVKKRSRFISLSRGVCVALHAAQNIDRLPPRVTPGRSDAPGAARFLRSNSSRGFRREGPRTGPGPCRKEKETQTTCWGSGPSSRHRPAKFGPLRSLQESRPRLPRLGTHICPFLLGRGGEGGAGGVVSARPGPAPSRRPGGRRAQRPSPSSTSAAGSSSGCRSPGQSSASPK